MTNRLGADFTTGSIPRNMLGFAIPYICASALQVFYSMVDMVIVGHFVGSTALSAVSISSQIALFFTAISIGYAGGGQVYISQLIGKGRRDKLNEAIGTLFSVVLLMAVVMTAVCLLLRRQLLGVLNTPPESWRMASDYLVICGGGLVFTFGYNLFSSILRGMGDSKNPLIFIAIATVVNTALDLLFVGGLGWGVAGAAWATIIGQAVSFLFAVVFLYRRKAQFGFDFRLRSFRIVKRVCLEITKLGGVLAIQTAAIYISMMFVNSLINRLGVTASAAFGVGLKINDLITQGTFGINVACTTMIGQNFAAGNLERVKKTLFCAWLFAGICYGVFSICFALSPHGFFGAFTNDADVLALAPLFVRAALLSFPGFVIMRGTNGIVQGTGFALLGFCAAMLDAVILRICLSLLFGFGLHMGLGGFFLGFCLAVYGSALPQLIYFLSGKWKTRRLMVE